MWHLPWMDDPILGKHTSVVRGPGRGRLASPNGLRGRAGEAVAVTVAVVSWPRRGDAREAYKGRTERAGISSFAQLPSTSSRACTSCSTAKKAIDLAYTVCDRRITARAYDTAGARSEPRLIICTTVHFVTLTLPSSPLNSSTTNSDHALLHLYTYRPCFPSCLCRPLRLSLSD